MSRLYNQFEFIGNLAIPEDSKFHRIIDNNNGWKVHKINFAIKESMTNSAFVELFGGYKKDESGVVFGIDKGGNTIKIPWKNRLNEDVVDTIADFSKIIIDLETDIEKRKEYLKIYFQIRNKERKDSLTKKDKEKLKELRQEFKEKSPNRYEFITEYDAIVFLTENLKNYENDYKFRITGNFNLEEYKGKIYRKYNPKLIEIVSNEEKNKLRARANIYFNKDSLDDVDYIEDKKIYINGYLQSRDQNVKKDRFFPQQFVIDLKNLDLENEQHLAIINLLKSHFQVSNKNYHYLQYEVSIYRGAERVEITMEDLTENQKMMINCGLAKLEEFTPRNGLLGENVDELRIIKPVLKKINNSNDFSDGAIDTEMNEKEFEELIVEDTSNISFDDVKEQEDLDNMLDDLLG